MSLRTPISSTRMVSGSTSHGSPARQRQRAAWWKPTIDSLGSVLGRADPGRLYTPDDDRITRLGLHRTIDENLGWNVAIKLWWRPAPDA